MVVAIAETGIEGPASPIRSCKRLSLPDMMDPRSLQCLSVQELTSLQNEGTQSIQHPFMPESRLVRCSPEAAKYREDVALDDCVLDEVNPSSWVARINRRIQIRDDLQSASKVVQGTHASSDRIFANQQPFGVMTEQNLHEELAGVGTIQFEAAAPKRRMNVPFKIDLDANGPKYQRLVISRSDPLFDLGKTASNGRVRGQPEAVNRYRKQYDPLDLPSLTPCGSNDPWLLPPLSVHRVSSRSPQNSLSKPKPSLTRLSSLDNLLRYRDEKAEWNRSSSMLRQERSRTPREDVILETTETFNECGPANVQDEGHKETSMLRNLAERPLSRMSLAMARIERRSFRNRAAEVGFCFTIAMTQFLAEYLISGFAIELSKLASLSSLATDDSQSMGAFWPASLLSLILSATLLIFARLSDMYGGYPTFLFGVAWLTIWTLIPGFFSSMLILDVARAMQGLAIAAFIPSTFAMVGSIYSEGPRKNMVLGLYSGCAPLGFFGGLFTAAALPEQKSEWYFWIASGLSGVTFITAYLTVPSDRTDRRRLDLRMDWVGFSLITSGLILISYALSVEPYANDLQTNRSGFQSSLVIGPLNSGLGVLAIAFWYEGWCAQCPLLPFNFFKPKNVKALSLAGLCFYATYGVWLYNSAELFQSVETAPTSDQTGISGIRLALWYIPTAVGGIVLCVLGGLLLHLVPIMSLLLLSAIAWVAAPLLLALAPLPLNYWKYVFPSMICATLGIDLTFTVCIVFLSSVQPLRYQGLTGAICSILVNLAMAFGLSISEIVAKKVETAIKLPASGDALYNSALQERSLEGLRAAFIYGGASAGVGLIVCALFVQISGSTMREQPTDVESPRSTSSASALVDGRDFLQADNGMLGKSQHQVRARLV